MWHRAVRGMIVFGVACACASGAEPAAAQAPPAAAEPGQGTPPAAAEPGQGTTPAAVEPEQGTPPAAAEPGQGTTPAGPAVREEAKKRHNEALASLRASRTQEAYEGFVEAWNLQGLPRVPRIAGNLGRAELELGKHRDAAEHLAFFLREEKGLSDENRKDVSRRLAEAKSKIGTLQVEVLPAGAEVYVDGARAGTSPLEVEIYVEPGRRKVEARLGARRTSREYNVAAGATATVQLDLSPEVPSSPPPAPPATRSRAPGFVLGGIGVLGLGAGLGAVLMHVDKRGQAAALHDDIRQGGGHCRPGPSTHAACPALHGAARDADTFLGAGAAILAGGAALTTAGVVYLLWAGKADRGASNVQLSAVPQLGGGVLSLAGEM
jgi:hypothetical protein